MSQFEKKCTCYGIIVYMKGCVKGPARFRRPHLKTKLFFFFFFVKRFFFLVSTVSRLAWHTIKKKLSMQTKCSSHTAECWVYMPSFYLLVFYWLESFTERESEHCSSNSGKHFVASAGCTCQASLLQVPWTALSINLHLRNSQYSAICDAFFMSSDCLYFICIIYCVFVRPIYQTVVIFWVEKKKKKKDNGVRFFNECQWWVWKEPVIGD